MRNLILLTMATLIFQGCGGALEDASKSDNPVTASSNYEIKISGTDTDFEVDTTSDVESTSSGIKHLSFVVTQMQFYTSGVSMSGTVTRHNGPGHVNVVIKKDGIPIYNQSITTSSGTLNWTAL